MKVFKKLLAGAVSAMLCASCIPALAYEIPHAYWSLNDSYSAALDAKNYGDIASYGSQVIDLISGEPSNDTTDNIIGSRAYEVAFAYYFTGDYDNAARYFNLYIPYGEKLGWNDGVRIAEEFVRQLPSSLSVYKHTSQNQKYYGARNEPNGVLSGQVSEKTEDGDSMVLLYLEYGYSDELNWANVVFNNAEKSGKAIELAVNFPDQGDTARAVSAEDGYLQQLYDLVSGYPNVPVFCRIGAEVNIWGNQCTPEEFKSAYCKISDKMRGLSNVAVVWSVAHTDPWKSDSRPYTTDDYYPGDENVDYVGITIYCNKYFDGREWNGQEKFNEVCFKTGYNSDPVLMIKDFVEKYGSRRPVMISECGAAYFTGGEINQNHIDWGAEHIKEIYSYVPMVYPQVKLMAYFNKKIDAEVNWYDLDSSSQMNDVYTEMNNCPWFIKGRNTNSAQTFFEPLGDSINGEGTVTVSAYPHVYGADTTKVSYYVDDKFITSADSAPYTANIPISGGSTLKVEAEGSNGHTVTRLYGINGGKAGGFGFNDTDGLSETSLAELKKVFDKGIITGYEDGSFKPDNTITRAEFAAMVCRMMGYASDEPCKFDDAKNHWAAMYIEACVDAGGINGVGGNSFAPDDNITVEQALKIVTIVRNMAEPTAVYPDGFIQAARKNALINNITTDDMSSDLKRIDAASIMAQAL